jgi:peptidoglycan lytic transglycosylase G
MADENIGPLFPGGTTFDPDEPPSTEAPVGALATAEPPHLEHRAADILPDRHHWGRSCLAIVLVLALFVGTVGAVVYFYGYRNLFPSGGQGDAVDIEIPDGTGVSGVGSLLESKSVISDAFLFRLYVRVKVHSLPIETGVYTFRKHSSVAQAIDVLRRGPHPPLSLRFTVPEALTIAEMTPIIGALPGITGSRFQTLATNGQVRWSAQPAAINTLEGLLFPDTYELLRQGLTEEAVVRRMLDGFQKTWDSLDKSALVQLGVSPYQAVIIASLVEEEAKIPEDRPLIASVIYNRLRQGIALQIDATILYVIGHKPVVLSSDLDVDSPYNTYKNVGLPPTPIGAPGRSSLDAALHPASTNYLYYVLCQKNGKHCFAQTQDEFERLKAQAEQDGVL